jgi:prepilin-type N-terminal cleavage/methylation domain-containing protein
MKKNNRNSGFTLVEIMIVVCIIGMLAAIAIPNFVRARQSSQTNACINNLRQIDAAKQTWALDKGQLQSATPTASVLAPYLGRGGTIGGNNVCCPLTTGAFGNYTINNLSLAPVCTASTGSTGNHASVLQ